MINLLNEVGNPRGHKKSKHHRAQRLINDWDYLQDKMTNMIERGKGISHPARCAYGVLLMMQTGIRIGNEGSAEGYICNHNKHRTERYPYTFRPPILPLTIKAIKQYKHGEMIQTFGLTTLQVKHTTLNRNQLLLNFTGKKGVDNELTIVHPILVKYLPILIDGKSQNEVLLDINYTELTKFVKKYIGKAFKPKDLRTAKVNLTFIANVNSKEHQKEIKHITKKGEVKKVITRLIAQTAEEIGHGKGVCKSAYLSKDLLDFYTDHLISKILK